MTRINILLATYNSSKYLREQLKSLYNQTYKDWILYVRDDGSKDNTLEILSEYTATYNNIVIVKDDKGGLGAKKSFMALLEAVEADYYMFCDHDDVWLPNKIEITIDALLKAEKNNPNKAVIVHTDLKLVDENLNVINESVWKHSKIKPEINKQKNYSMVNCYMTGCTMGFNNQAKLDLASDMPEEAAMHDAWMAIQAAFKSAIVVSIQQPTILYRTHHSQEVGVKEVGALHYLNKIRNLQTTFKVYKKQYPLMKKVGYGSMVKFYFYKFLYTIRRNF